MTAIELDIHRWMPHVHENEENLHADQNSTNIVHSIPTFYSFGQNESMERPTFDLEVASCGMPKNTRLPIPETNYSLTGGSFGDDAGFTMIGFHKHFLGISDGAGGNLMYGYDPRLFSESLMRHCSDLAYSGDYCSSNPKRLLCHAFDRVQNENSCFGSATACILGVDSRLGRLYSVNIGDSGYVVVRHGVVVYRSRSQALNGDCPRQLDVYPWTASLKRHGLNYTQLSSSDAICQTFDLQLDDIVILSTDGLFDNVPDRLIEFILANSRSLQHAAQLLVIRAVRFYVKPDDILVIMARVIENPNL